MADNTGIVWTDATGNPVTICTKVSSGCKHCDAGHPEQGKRITASVASLLVFLAPCALAKTSPSPPSPPPPPYAVPARQIFSGLPTTTFRRILLGQIPLSPGQIHVLKKRWRASQQAAVAPVRPVKDRSLVAAVTPAPGMRAVRVRIARGYVSAITFVDQAGHGWPVAAAYSPDPRALQVLPSRPAPNTILLNILSRNPFARAIGFDVILSGLDIPITLIAESGRRSVDTLTVLRVAGLSPQDRKALSGGGLAVPTTSGLGSTASHALMRALAGIAPKGAHAVFRGYPGVLAWRQKSQLFLRLATGMQLLSPAWASRAAAHHYTAYVLPMIEDVLIMNNGHVVSLHATRKLKGHSHG